jgi:uncharacterized delta-60 repeat protein
MNRRLPFSTIAVLIIVFVVTVAVIPMPPVQAAAGNLDPTFGTNGKVTTEFGERSPDGHAFSTDDSVTDMAIQPDGKVIVVGFSLGFYRSGAALARYNPNGSLDSTFGVGGKVVSTLRFGISSVTLQPDGKIIAGGGDGRSMGAVRFNTDGSLDTTFGNGGTALVDFHSHPLGMQVVGNDIGLQSDGKIIVAGYVESSSHADFALVRLNINGSLDTSFGDNGRVTTDFETSSIPVYVSEDWIFGLSIQTDNKIVVAGTASKSNELGNLAGYRFALARYNVNGSVDTSFGTSGRVTTDLPSSGGQGVVVQPDGRILVVGYGEGTSDENFESIFLIRYNRDGSLDNTFGSGGIVSSDFSGGFNKGKAIALQQNGKIVIVGRVSGAIPHPVAGMVTARYNSNGSLDSSFGDGGKIITVFGNPGADGGLASSVALQSDGRIVVAGTSRNTHTGEDFSLVRLLGDPVEPPFDLCIQDESNGNLLQINTTTGEYQFSNCGGLTIGSTGTLTKRGNQITLQHNASDRRVMASIDSSTNKATGSIQLLSQGWTFSITDRNITNNTCACR